jgi:hypothetical protein
MLQPLARQHRTIMYHFTVIRHDHFARAGNDLRALGGEHRGHLQCLDRPLACCALAIFRWLVASSTNRIAGRLHSACASGTSCFWPPDSTRPMSPSKVLNGIGMAMISGRITAICAVMGYPFLIILGGAGENADVVRDRPAACV